MAKRYFIITWGCQMNQADAERIAGDYELRGYKKAPCVEDADELVLTTCSVRKSAEDRVRGYIHNLIQKYRDLPKRPKIIVTGCMLHYGEEKLRAMMPHVDEFLHISEVGLNTPSLRQHSKHALVPISSGCNSFCTYCIVPLARGREKSRPQKDILTDISRLVKKDYETFTLLGQNVNSYGLEKIGMSMRKRLDENREIPAPQTQYKPFKGTSPFVQLLDAVCALPGVKKVNFMSSNPWDFYEELIECIARNSQINREIHLPVQSGDNEILEKMNRGYTREQYLELIKRIKEKIPEAQFTTDIIVGFPGETEENFQNTVDLCQKVTFNIAYIGKYSPRPGTVSAKLMKDSVSDAEKISRWRILDALINRK